MKRSQQSSSTQSDQSTHIRPQIVLICFAPPVLKSLRVPLLLLRSPGFSRDLR